MSCCNPILHTFISETTTTVPYIGVRPIVEVAYLQPDNTFKTAGIFTLINITATDVVVDHGGATETGIVKLSQ